ncbi:MAG: hypothetical protein GXP31_13525 [Kiritimatiellaeota bacterium]|nr:hypothetical protein [Kiritimatiellota bacterium]
MPMIVLSTQNIPSNNRTQFHLVTLNAAACSDVSLRTFRDNPRQIRPGYACSGRKNVHRDHPTHPIHTKMTKSK